MENNIDAIVSLIKNFYTIKNTDDVNNLCNAIYSALMAPFCEQNADLNSKAKIFKEQTAIPATEKKQNQATKGYEEKQIQGQKELDKKKRSC